MADGGSITWRVGLTGGQAARDELRSLGPAAAAGAREAQGAIRQLGGAADATATRYENMAAAIRSAAIQASATPVQQRINRTVDLGGGKSASDSARFFEEAERQATALRAAIDPLSVAQARYSSELARAQALARGGFISKGELVKQEEILRRRLDETTAAYKRQDAAQANAKRGGMSTNMRNTAIYTASDIVASAGSGMGFGQIALQQGPQVFQAMAVSANGAKGAIAALLNPWTLLAAAVTGVVVAQQVLEHQQAKTTAELRGVGAASGVTIDALYEISRAAADASGSSIGFSREAAKEFATVGKVGAENLKSATVSVEAVADAMGVKAKDALGTLAKAYADPASGAVELNSQLGFLTAAQIDQIQTMQEQGDKAGALKLLLDNLNGSLPPAEQNMSRLAQVGRDVKNGFLDAADGVGNFLKALAGTKTTAQRLQEFDDRRNWFGYLPETQEERDLRAQAKAEADRISQAQLAARSVSATAAYDRLNPKDSQIGAIQNSQVALRAALADPKLAAAMGKSTDQIKAAIAAGDKQIEQIQKRGEKVDRHAASLARDTEAMRQNTAGAIASASAYLTSEAAGAKAEIRRRSNTDAARSGADAEKRYAGQLALSAAEAAANGAKSVAELRSQLDARQAVNDNVATGIIASRDAERAMQDEAALRPLLIAKTYAHGEALKQITAVIEAYRKALKDAHAEEGRTNLQAGLATQLQTAAELDERLARAGRPKAQREDDASVRTAAQRRLVEMTKDENSANTIDGKAWIENEVSNARKRREADSLEAAGDMLRSQQEANDQVRVEIGLVGRSAASKREALAIEATKRQLLQQNISLESQQGRAILDAVRAGEELNRTLELQNASFEELQQVGEQVVDTVLDPSNWKNWGDAGKRMLQDLGLEFMRLAAMNPLKNMLFGSNLPTLSSVGGLFGGGDLLGGLFGGSSSSSGVVSLVDPASYGSSRNPFFSYASGTDYHPGGYARVGEEGPENVWLPPGAKVQTAAQTRAALATPAGSLQAGGGSAGSTNVSVHYHGSQKMREQVTRQSDGSTRIDLYEDLGRDILREAGRNGDLARAGRTSPPLKKYA